MTTWEGFSRCPGGHSGGPTEFVEVISNAETDSGCMGLSLKDLQYMSNVRQFCEPVRRLRNAFSEVIQFRETHETRLLPRASISMGEMQRDPVIPK